MSEQQFRISASQVRGQFRRFAMKGQLRSLESEFQTRVVSPARQPLEQFAAGQKQRFAVHFSAPVKLGQPLNELPVFRRKEFLLVAGPRRQLDDFTQRFASLAGATARQDEPDAQSP